MRTYCHFEGKKYVYLVMEYCDSGDLTDFFDDIRRKKQALGEDDVFLYFMEMTQAVYFLHSNGVAHGAINPTNIFQA